MRDAELGHLTNRGARQGLIRPHRGLRQLTHRPRDLLFAGLLAVAMTLTWLVALPTVASFWRAAIDLGNRTLGLGGTLAQGGLLIPTSIGASMPRLMVEAALPSTATLIIALLVCAALFAVTTRVPSHLLPLAYGIRVVVVVELTAIIYFAFTDAPALANVADASFAAASVIVAAIPALLGLTLYLFDPSLLRSAAATVLLMGHLTILLPIQYLLQMALITQGSQLLAPVCFLVLGPALDVMVLVAFYGWAMARQPVTPPLHPSGIA